MANSFANRQAERALTAAATNRALQRTLTWNDADDKYFRRTQEAQRFEKIVTDGAEGLSGADQEVSLGSSRDYKKRNCAEKL